jgi:hypothetical protein
MLQPDPFPPIGLRKLSSADCAEFWERYAALRPGLRLYRGNRYSRWRPVAGTDIFISLYLTNRSVGLFVRGERGLSLKGAARKLDLYEPRLGIALGVAAASGGYPYLARLALPATDVAAWPRGQQWLLERETFYHATLARIVGGIEDAAGSSLNSRL